MSNFLDRTGLTVKRLETIVDDLGQDLKDNLGQDIDLSVNSTIGAMNSVVGGELATVWEYLEETYNAFNIRTAEGFHLDNLVLLGGVTRRAETPSTGFVQCTGGLNTYITSNSFVATLDKTNFKFDTDLTITPSVCTHLSLQAIVQVTLDTAITITIQGALYSATLAGDLQSDYETAITELITEITGANSLQYSAEQGADSLSINIIRQDNYFDSLGVSYSSVLNVLDVSSQVSVTATELGENDIPPEHIVHIATPVSGWVSVRNKERFVGGMIEETDEQLRARYFSNLTKSTSATYDAIYGALVALDGVASVQIEENETQGWQQDGVDIPVPSDPEAPVSGRLPPHSFECIVYGGDVQEIPQTLWDTKPLGIQTHGIVVSDVNDANGNAHTIRWTRPENEYLWVDVKYTLASGGLLAPDEVTALADAIVAYGATLTVGETVLYQVIVGIVYKTLPLVGLIQVSIGLDGTTTPVESPTLVYDANYITGSGAVSLWDTERVTATIV